MNQFKCPKCKKEINRVNVLSECWQKAELIGNKIVNYSSIEETLETKKIECPECHKNIDKHIKE